MLLVTEQEFSRRFGIAIRRWRGRLNMDVKEFADFIGTSERTIYYYEQGRCMPQLYTAMLIAEKLGTSLDGLIRGD